MPSAPAAAPPARPATSTPAIVILGADAWLAARPASPGQLANACYAAGYSAVIPASWGDELVAAGCLREIAARGQGSVVLCSCPRVADRMRRVESLLPQLLPMASPPVAAARYLRARAGRHGVHITFVGECPGGADPAIDRHATPGALLRSLAKRGIDPTTQPTEVEERLLRDGRRFYSLPGGAPAPNWLYVEKRGYTLIEPTARDFLAEVAFRVSKKERRVVDLAPRLGCSCSGAVVGQPWTEARDKVAAVEPPRAVHEILDHDVQVDLSASLDPWTGSTTGGEATIPIPLDVLAAIYNPQARSSTIRSLPPPPVQRLPRVSGRVPGEPSTPTRPPAPPTATLDPETAAAGSSHSRAAAEPKGIEPAAQSGGTQPTASVAPHPTSYEPPARARRSQPTAARSKSSDEVAREGPSVSGGSADADEGSADPRSSRPSGRAVVGDDGLRAPSDEMRAARIRRWSVVTVSLALAICVTILLAMLFLGRGPFGSTPRSGSGPNPPSPTAPRSPASEARPTVQTMPTPSSPASPSPLTASDTAVDTTDASPTAATPDLPRLPIRPASAPASARSTRGLSRSSDTVLSPRVFRANPAPVATPGAAPIPHGVSPGVTGEPTATAASSGGAPKPAAAELAAIRAEIARRRHRVDSLRHVVDSLGYTIPQDSSR